ncbi:Ribonuclease H-like domain containing protein [Trema orientale]|uniref:Ribonuclease H-like domain containing protein n=1 Tax=Trema orientale TaxID=63057 RepID=A0A2P5FLH5_TREOI|nr:Ribonuclease H-like domain containing protein [Trema orientale]
MAQNVNLDILALWKSNECRYLDLAIVARDILSIPVSIVASEASFSVWECALDLYRSTLKADTVDAIICLKDWLGGITLLKNLNEVTQDIFKMSLSEEPSSGCSNSVRA